MMESKDQDLFDDDAFDLILSSIPDEMVELESPKYGLIRLHRRGIFKLCSRGASVRDISAMFGITEKSLYNHVSREMQAGKSFIGPRLKFNLLRQAMAGEKVNATLLIFALKNWTDLNEDGIKPVEEQEGSNQWKVSPPVFEHKTTMTDSEREEVEGDDTDD